jgi:hypothetical protein
MKTTASALVLCPCCGFRTLPKRGDDEICQVCFWHDDGQDDPHADEVWGGPNKDLSLTQARANFREFGQRLAGSRAAAAPRGALKLPPNPSIQSGRAASGCASHTLCVRPAADF